MNSPAYPVSARFSDWFRKKHHKLWVRYMRIRYPYRPPPEGLVIYSYAEWKERPDGLYQLHVHDASPFDSDLDKDQTFEKYPRTCFMGQWPK